MTSTCNYQRGVTVWIKSHCPMNVLNSVFTFSWLFITNPGKLLDETSTKTMSNRKSFMTVGRGAFGVLSVPGGRDSVFGVVGCALFPVGCTGRCQNKYEIRKCTCTYRICRNRSPGRIGDPTETVTPQKRNFFKGGGEYMNLWRAEINAPSKITFVTINALGVYFGKYGTVQERNILSAALQAAVAADFRDK